MSTNDKPSDADGRKIEKLRDDVDRTRSEMSQTIQQLEDRFKPSDLEARVKNVVHEEIQEVRTVLKEELADAKVAVNEVLHNARQAVKEDVIAAKDAVTNDVKEAVANAKASARAATIGKLEDIATKAGDAMNTTRTTLVDTVRQNPIPAALVGVGIAWLFMNRSTTASRKRQEEQQSFGYADAHESALGAMGRKVVDVEHKLAGVAHDATGKAGDAIGQAVDATGALAHDASAKASHAMQTVSAGIANAAHAVPEQARRAEQVVGTFFQDNALIVGAAVVAVGAIVGMSLPRTQREDALMGRTRDHLLEKGQEAAHHAADNLKQMSEDAAKSVTSALHA